MLLVAGCLLIAVGYLWFAVVCWCVVNSCLVFVVCSVLVAVGYRLRVCCVVGDCLLFVICGLVFIVVCCCWLRVVVCCWLCVGCCL